MKKLFLHSFLCAAMMVVAPSIGWSGTSDELWQGSEINDKMEPVFTSLDNTVLSVDKLLKFIAALPEGVEEANELMNDSSVTIGPYNRGMWTPGFLLSLGLGAAGGAAGGFFGLSAGMAVAAGGTSMLLNRQTLIGIGVGGVIGLVGGTIWLRQSRRNQAAVEQFGHEQVLLFNAPGFEQTPCNMRARTVDSSFEASSEIQYQFSHCRDQDYSGVIRIENNTGQPSIKVKTKQGVYQYNPDSQIFEQVAVASA